MQKIDIRLQKNELRHKSKQYRSELSKEQKYKMDARIMQNLFSLNFFVKAKTFLCYMSTEIEVDTKNIISALFEDKKTVAVPLCPKEGISMSFYQINNFSQTAKQRFGVMEPVKEFCEKLRDFRNSVCIIPALAFDESGYRLGYGKGYYDRFLSEYKGLKIGLCYNECIYSNLPHGFYDIAADIVVTDERIIYAKTSLKERGEANGREKF